MDQLSDFKLIRDSEIEVTGFEAMMLSFSSHHERLTLNIHVHSSVLSSSHPDSLVWSAAP